MRALQGHDFRRPSTPSYRSLCKFRRNTEGTQVILREGEVLYIPSYWFHYIVSLDGSIQCNTRSGSSNRGRPDIKECGFY